MIDFTQFPSPCYIMEEDKKRSRQGGSGDYSCFQVVCYVALFPYIP